MNEIKIMKYTYSLCLIVLMALIAFTACSEDVNLWNSIDETPYLAANRIDGLLVDESTNKNSSVVEMNTDEYSTNLVFRLSKKPEKGVDVKISFDEAYATTYNSIHNTDFELFPTSNVKIYNDGEFVLAPDDQSASGIKVTLTAFEGMDEAKTYIVPFTATSPTDGITFSENSKHAVLLVKDYRKMADHDKGADIQTVIYFEVNDVNPLNALEFKIASGKYFFDHVVLFAANINWDAEKKRVYVSNNENVQYLLDHNEEYLQPLRRAGMKVIISILGNHDEAGVAQLSDMGAKEFARELAAYCRGYKLDGVAFDDEYSGIPNLSNPWLAEKSAYAGSRLMYECKAAMPEKIVSLYNLGSMYSYGLQIIDGVTPGLYCDYAVADYGLSARPGIGMTLKQCGGMSIELYRWGGDSSEDCARNKKNEGYGYYMYFALDPLRYSSQIDRCQTSCKGLYEEELVYPTHYYKKNDTKRLPL